MDVILIFLATLALSVAVTPLARRAALRVGIISVPRSRDVHVQPVPLLGGAAIIAAFVGVLGITMLFSTDRAYLREISGILLGAGLIALVGLADDRWNLPASIKMGGQALAGVLLLVGGTQVQLFELPLLDWLLTLVWVVGITNALNFLDNMDGLSGGVATIAAAFFVLLAAMNEPRQVLVGTMAAALMGACIGFLRYNWMPGTIFMGDTGSLFIGFMLAVLAIKLRFPANVPYVTWTVPICVLAVPIFDTSLVFVSRLRRGVNPFTTAGKDHLSHRLAALGMTKREAVLTCYLLCGTCGMIATFLAQARLDEALVVMGAVVLAGVGSIIWLEYICPAGVPRQKLVP